MDDLTTVYLLRHAQSQANRHIPESDWSLSTHGCEQAEGLKALLALLGIDVIYTSPYTRAVDTVMPFAQHAGLRVDRVEGLRERQLTTGSLPNWFELVQQSWRDFDFALPHGESNAQCQARIIHTIRHLVALQRGRVLLVSSHGNAIALYLHALDASYSFDQWVAMRNPDIFRIYYHGLEPVWDQTFTLEVSLATSAVPHNTPIHRKDGIEGPSSEPRT
jgi:2,3-bisphosphoglycerate-dependent phosphoglycerate mutase